jgi:hypothetical protein
MGSPCSNIKHSLRNHDSIGKFHIPLDHLGVD